MKKLQQNSRADITKRKPAALVNRNIAISLIVFLAIGVSTASSQTITSITLFSANSSGDAASGQIFNTQLNDGIWVCGVTPADDPTILNNANTTISIPITGEQSYDLYANHTPPLVFRNPGQFFGLNIFFDNSIIPGISAIGQLYTSTLIPNFSPNTIGMIGFDKITGAGSLTYISPTGETVTLTELFIPGVTGVNLAGRGEHFIPPDDEDGVVTITLLSGYIPVELLNPTVTSITLFSANSSGDAASGQIFNTQYNDGIWVCGVTEANDLTILNNAYTRISIPITGEQSYDLYANHTPPLVFRNPGQFFGLNIFFDNSIIPGISAIGQLYTSTLIPNSSLNTIGMIGFGTVPGVGSLTYISPTGKTVTLTELFIPGVTGVNLAGRGEHFIPPDDEDGVVTITLLSGYIPVELASFTVSAIQGNVILEWTTQSETENLGFHIYRSTTKESGYTQLIQDPIPGSGTSDEAHTYSYTDHNVEPGNTYYYKLADVDFKGNTTFHGPVSVTVAALPTNYSLEQNYPNPFNPETVIGFSIKEAGKVSLKIYSLQGQLLRTLIDDEKPAAHYSVRWNGKDDYGNVVASGIYLYTLKINRFEQTRKLVFMK